MQITDWHLTEKQQEAMRVLARSPTSVWHFGSTTVNRLRRLGLAFTASDGALALTPEGREYVRRYVR